MLCNWKDDIIDMATVKARLQLVSYVSSEKRPAAMPRPGEVGCLYKGAGPIRLQLRALRVPGHRFLSPVRFQGCDQFFEAKRGLR